MERSPWLTNQGANGSHSIPFKPSLAPEIVSGGVAWAQGRALV